MTDPSHRISIRKIQIRAKSAAPNHPTPTPIIISLKASDSILRQKDSRTWGNLDWKFRPPVELHADSEISIVISPAPSATAQLDDEQVLATIAFADVLALPRQNSRRVHLQLEHDLATVRISFTVAAPLNQGPPAPLWDSLKRRFFRQFRALFRVNEGSDAAPTAPPRASKPGGPQHTLSLITPLSDIYTESDFNAVPVDGGKIQYTVVGTKRPKPQ